METKPRRVVALVSLTYTGEYRERPSWYDESRDNAEYLVRDQSFWEYVRGLPTWVEYASN